MARTKITSPQLNPAKTTDANGWTVYDFGAFKQYRMRATFSFSLGSGSTTSLSLSNNTLPVGMSSLGTNYLNGSMAINGNAYGITWNFEMTTANTVISVTCRNNSGSTLTQNGYMDFLISSS